MQMNENPDAVEPVQPDQSSSNLKWKCWKCHAIWLDNQTCSNCQTSLMSYDGDDLSAIIISDDSTIVDL